MKKKIIFLLIFIIFFMNNNSIIEALTKLSHSYKQKGITRSEFDTKWDEITKKAI